MQPRPPPLVAWWLATRPKTLTASLTPVIVGTALAYQLQGYVDLWLVLLTTTMAIALQIGINLINDALDFKRGADTDARIGFPRATQQGWLSTWQVLCGGWIAFAVALLCAVPLAMQSGGIILVIVLICIAGGYLYSGGPYPLAYLGLSDPAVLLFFGLVATGTTVYIQTLSWPISACIAGLQIGLLATAISALNNARDIDEDRAANKRTLPVRYGLFWARMEIATVLYLPFCLSIYWWQQGLLEAALLPLLALPLALSIACKVCILPPSRAYNSLLVQAALTLLLFGLLLSMALLYR